MIRIDHQPQRVVFPRYYISRIPSNDNQRNFRIGATKYFPAGEILIGKYKNGGHALIVNCPKTAMPLYTATINIPHASPRANDKYIHIPEWGVFEGVIEALEKEGLVRRTGIYHEFKDLNCRAQLVLMSLKLISRLSI